MRLCNSLFWSKDSGRWGEWIHILEKWQIKSWFLFQTFDVGVRILIVAVVYNFIQKNMQTSQLVRIYESRYVTPNNVVCATNKCSDQLAHTRSLIRAFASRLNILRLLLKLLTEPHLAFLSLKGGCTGLSESTLVKMPHC